MLTKCYIMITTAASVMIYPSTQPHIFDDMLVKQGYGFNIKGFESRKDVSYFGFSCSSLYGLKYSITLDFKSFLFIRRYEYVLYLLV